MFYQITHHEIITDGMRDMFSHLIEVPTRGRAAAYAKAEHERTGDSITMHQIFTADEGIAPPGYVYLKQQIWVDAGKDTGWVRIWVKFGHDKSRDGADAMAFAMHAYGDTVHER